MKSKKPEAESRGMAIAAGLAMLPELRDSALIALVRRQPGFRVTIPISELANLTRDYEVAITRASDLEMALLVRPRR